MPIHLSACCSAAVIGSVKSKTVSHCFPGYPNLSESIKPLGKDSNKGWLTKYEDGMIFYYIATLTLCVAITHILDNNNNE